jgi:hypothetical protein
MVGPFIRCRQIWVGILTNKPDPLSDFPISHSLMLYQVAKFTTTQSDPLSDYQILHYKVQPFIRQTNTLSGHLPENQKFHNSLVLYQGFKIKITVALPGVLTREYLPLLLQILLNNPELICFTCFTQGD